MPIPMERPLRFMMDPNVRRFGAILKDINTGQIVGHLKETGEMGRLLTSLSSPFGVNPVSITIDVIDRAIKTYQIAGVQNTVDEIQKTVEALQLATNVAALASVANLGISFAGFAVVNQKLSRIESKIDRLAKDVESIRQALKKMDQNWDAMSLARLQRAAKNIDMAEKASSRERKLDLVHKAVEDFALLRHYYLNLLRTEGLFDDVELAVEDLQELAGRYTFCCMGELHAEFATGDLGAYRNRLDTITSEYRELICFSPKALYEKRSDRLNVLAIDHDHKTHAESLLRLSDFSKESADRIESFSVEVDYLKKNNLTVEEYLRELREHETAIMLLPR
jgi:hypothetical protein